MFQFSANIYPVDLRLFLKNCISYFQVTFSKTPLVAGIFLRGSVNIMIQIAFVEFEGLVHA